MSCLHWWKMLIGEGFESFLTFADSYGGSCWFSVWILQNLCKEENILSYVFRNLICTSIMLMHLDPFFNKKKERESINKLQLWCHSCKIANPVPDIVEQNSLPEFSGSCKGKGEFHPIWLGNYQSKRCPHKFCMDTIMFALTHLHSQLRSF